MSRDSAYLLDIINSCDRVTSIVERSPYEELYADRVIQDAVMYRLTVIGEASRRLSE
jgi:uncharacterized protein with HEPN domain